MKNHKKVAFVTYNTLDQVTSGWHEKADRKALVIQNTRGLGSLQNGPMNTEQTRNEIGLIWNELEQNLATLDHIVVYVGASGSERAIELAASIPAEKVTLIGCRCGINEKELLVQAFGLGKANRLLCECGGHRTMKKMFDSFLELGTLFPAFN